MEGRGEEEALLSLSSLSLSSLSSLAAFSLPPPFARGFHSLSSPELSSCSSSESELRTWLAPASSSPPLLSLPSTMMTSSSSSSFPFPPALSFPSLFLSFKLSKEADGEAGKE